MTDVMYLPAGSYTTTLIFRGAYVPTGAAVSFQGLCDPLDTPAAIAATVKTAYWDRVKPSLTDGVICDLIYVRVGRDNGVGPSSELAVGTGGSIATPGASPAVSFLFKKATGEGGRRMRGRIFQPGVSEANVDGAGTVLAGTITTLNTALALTLSDLVAANRDMAIAHHYDVLFVGPKEAPTPVNSLLVSSTVATQRRRQRR